MNIADWISQLLCAGGGKIPTSLKHALLKILAFTVFVVLYSFFYCLYGIRVGKPMVLIMG